MIQKLLFNQQFKKNWICYRYYVKDDSCNDSNLNILLSSVAVDKLVQMFTPKATCCHFYFSIRFLGLFLWLYHNFFEVLNSTCPSTYKPMQNVTTASVTFCWLDFCSGSILSADLPLCSFNIFPVCTCASLRKEVLQQTSVFFFLPPFPLQPKGNNKIDLWVAVTIQLPAQGQACKLYSRKNSHQQQKAKQKILT